MKIRILLIFVLFFLYSFVSAQSPSVSDADGNIYHQIKIGSQIWLKENLRTTRYSNGDQIGTSSPAGSIKEGENQPKYQWAYNGNESYVPTYGRLYTWYAATDLRGACPDGFHLPTDEEWTSLTDYLGGISVAGGKLKEAGFAHWNNPNTGATNESGFSALPGTNPGLYGYYWSSSDDEHNEGWLRIFYYNYTELSRNPYSKIIGYSVRCIKDQTTLPVYTNSVTAVSSTTVRISSNIDAQGGKEIFSRGICWSKNPNPTVSDFHSDDDKVIGPLTTSLENLVPNTTYYAKAFASNANGLFYGKEVSFKTTVQLSDKDGNIYNTVKIGDQLWMKENLRAILYRNGDTIPTTSPDTLDLTMIEINDTDPPKYRWAYNGDESNVLKYGQLYTKYAASDPRGICPIGWHLPSSYDWEVLTDFLGGEAVTGGKLKATESNSWKDPNTGATNITGFSALPGGFRSNTGKFINLGNTGSWLCSDEPNITGFWLRSLSYDEQKLTTFTYGNFRDDGYSARCIKDKFTVKIDDVSSSPQDSLEIWITLGELIREENIHNYSFDIEYNQSNFTFNGFKLDETASSKAIMEADTSLINKLTVYGKCDTPLQGKWTLVKLKFRTLSALETQFKISNVIFNDTIVPDISKDILAYWDVTAPKAKVTYDHNEISFGDELLITVTFSEPMDNSRDILITIGSPWNLNPEPMTRVSPEVYTYLYQVPVVTGTASIILWDCADISGNSIESSPEGGSFTVKNNLGDVNTDGNILSNDAVLALSYSVGLDPLPEEDPVPWESWRVVRSNVDNKPGISAYDASLILQRSLDLIFIFPAETGIQTAPSENDNVSVSKENGNLVFRSAGNFYSLDLFLSGQNKFLKSPSFIDRTILTAVNITDTSYAVGICTSIPLRNNTLLMKIPYYPGSDSMMNFTLYINGDPKQIDKNTDAVSTLPVDPVNLWPNPSSAILNLKGIIFGSIYEVLDTEGRILLNGVNTDNRIDISNIPEGIYILKIRTPQNLFVRSFVKLGS
jgi:uncharacterized protein (TIGR02145 family)